MIESLSRRLQSAIAIGWIALVWITIFAIAIGLAWFVMAAIAHAEGDDSRWVYRTIKRYYVNCDTWDGSCYRAWRYVRVRIRSYAYHYPEREPTWVYGYSHREDDGGRCRDVRRAVGQQALSADGAKKEANDAWAATVRFHIGEMFMSLDNARDVVYVCSRSSIKEPGTSVTTLGQAFTRCEISAIPCAPRREREDQR